MTRKAALVSFLDRARRVPDVRRLFTAAALATSLTACTTSTAPGAVGIERRQLLLVSSAVVERSAQEGYLKLSSEASGQGRLNRDPVVTDRVRTIATKLAGQVGAFRADALSWKWEINVFDSPDVNAFCMPGGKIGVYTGLLNKVRPTDDELAAVMGHEIAHALREHTREKVSQQSLSNAVVQGLAASNARNAGAAAALGAVGAQMFLHLPFSRDMELEADVMGLELMARAGFDPRAASSLWRKMAALSKDAGKSAEFFSTHPSSDRRIAAIDAAVPKVRALYETQRPQR